MATNSNLSNLEVFPDRVFFKQSLSGSKILWSKQTNIFPMYTIAKISELYQT